MNSQKVNQELKYKAKSTQFALDFSSEVKQISVSNSSLDEIMKQVFSSEEIVFEDEFLSENESIVEINVVRNHQPLLAPDFVEDDSILDSAGLAVLGSSFELEIVVFSELLAFLK